MMNQCGSHDPTDGTIRPKGVQPPSHPGPSHSNDMAFLKFAEKVVHVQ